MDTTDLTLASFLTSCTSEESNYHYRPKQVEEVGNPSNTDFYTADLEDRGSGGQGNLDRYDLEGHKT